jgi:hypothetical protein
MNGPAPLKFEEPVMEWITDSPKQLDELKHALECRHPFRASE